MANKRIDEPTGTETVGHEWDGIEELNTPLPRWWLWTFYLTIIFSIGYVIAYPAWPMIDRATAGVLGWSSRGDLADDMSAADQARTTFREQLARVPIERLPEGSALLQQAIAGGSAAFKVNCVQCHGSGAAGSQDLGYPNLNDDAWLWGGDLRSIEYTITHGIREAGRSETRNSAMPAYEGVFSKTELDALAAHVLTLGREAQSTPVGNQLFADNCSVCHGANGGGNRELGAPTLNDAVWLRGSSAQAIKNQILNPRMGMMPGFAERLDPVTIKMLAAYVHSLGGGEDFIEVAQDPEVAVDEQP